MCEDNWTNAEEERQDDVDNAIYNLMVELAPWAFDNVEWDMEYIGAVRNIIQEFLVDKLHLMTEQEFYPYRETDRDGNIILEPSKELEAEGFVISDQFGKMSHAVEDSVGCLDAQEFADLVGEFYGGTCRYIGEYKYRFIPNSDYQGGLDDIKEKNNG